MPNRRPLILILLALFVLWLWGNLSGLPWGIPCLFRRFTGLSCPTCGTQRALFALLHGDPLTAWHFNYLCLSSPCYSAPSLSSLGEKAPSIVPSPPCRL